MVSCAFWSRGDLTATHYLFGRGLTILLLSSSYGSSNNNIKGGTNIAFVESRLSTLSPRHHHCLRSSNSDGDAIGNTLRLFNDNGHHHPNRRRRRFIPQHGKSQDRMETSRKNTFVILCSPRGGGAAAAAAAAAAHEPTKSITSSLGSKTTFLNDDDVDQLVDELIASVNDDISGRDNQRQTSTVEPVNKKESDGEEEIMTRNNNDDDERCVDKESALGATTQKSNSPPDTVQCNAQSPNYHPHHYFTTTSLRPNPAFSLPSTPTNAYYRFILRRGPRGHVLASFTVVAVQWVYTYVPTLFQLISYLLVKFYIYNPKILYERDRHRSITRYSTTNSRESGLKQKFNFFGKSKQEQVQRQKQQQSMLQKHSDEEAATKLRQLYRTIKIGSGLGMLSEVKYRYLSVAFRRKHGLGKEYRMEKPKSFWGEIVRGSTRVGENLDEGLDIVDDMIPFDDEMNEKEDIEHQRDMISSVGSGNKPRRGQMQRSHIVQPRQGRRKLVADWVVDAFSRHPPSPLTTSESSSTHANMTRSKVNKHVQISSLWTEVDRDAIIEAAWESRAADPSVAKYQGRRQGAVLLDSDNSRYGSGGTPGASGTGSSGYSASKMFQSVMTRVGSNGRVLGAYPNDALPIEQCANERGVLGLARRYGYGDWTTSLDDGDDSDDNEGGDDLWGGNLD